MKKLAKIICLAILLLLLVVAGFCGYILHIFYPAGDRAHSALISDADVSVTVEEEYIVFSPDNPRCGFIFYPGGTVEASAYAPLLRSLAEEDILCILVEMPLNLAVLDMYAAEEIPEVYPQITDWYIGGHSLGGSSAAYHLEKTEDDFRGLVLLAAYSSVDLREKDLRVCCIYGTEDAVMNRENYQDYKVNLPVSSEEVLIEGGNHAQFGDYGPQNKDGIAGISAEEQLSITVEALLRFFRQ